MNKNSLIKSFYQPRNIIDPYVLIPYNVAAILNYKNFVCTLMELNGTCTKTVNITLVFANTLII